MTSPSPLDRLAGPGNVLAKEAPDAKEFDGLVRSGVARLKDGENEANSLAAAARRRFNPRLVQQGLLTQDDGHWTPAGLLGDTTAGAACPNAPG
jgi:hypothetical protein